jgi:hypothetical protein
MRRRGTTASSQSRSFGDVGSMSGLPDSGHGWAIYDALIRPSCLRCSCSEGAASSGGTPSSERVRPVVARGPCHDPHPLVDRHARLARNPSSASGRQPHVPTISSLRRKAAFQSHLLQATRIVSRGWVSIDAGHSTSSTSAQPAIQEITPLLFQTRRKHDTPLAARMMAIVSVVISVRSKAKHCPGRCGTDRQSWRASIGFRILWLMSC